MHARESFWFLPAVLGLAAIALGLGCVELDRLLVREGVSRIPLVEDLSATGGRAILSAIGATMLGVAATSFSITISVLATTSSAYGPRLVRNFMADRGNQLVLAVLTSTFLYSLMVLRSIHTEEDSAVAFVPVIAVSVAVLLAVADVGVLVFFIHHIASSVQISTLQQRVLADLEGAIDIIYPVDRDPEAVAAHTGHSDGHVIASPATGYVNQIDIAKLVSIGRAAGARYRLVAHPGDYIVEGDGLVEASYDHTDERQRSVIATVTIGSGRTPHQDLRFAVQQLTEIAVRGLASGTNDPYTAVGALDALAGALETLARRSGPESFYLDPDGETRVEAEWPTVAQLFASVYSAVRTYGIRHPLVVDALLRMTDRLERVVTQEARLALHREVRECGAAYQRESPDGPDSAQTIERFEKMVGRLSKPANA